MKHLFVDCQFGISGDMLLASLVDLGADVNYIESELKKLPLDPFEMRFEERNEHGIQSKHLVLTFDREQQSINPSDYMKHHGRTENTSEHHCHEHSHAHHHHGDGHSHHHAHVHHHGDGHSHHHAHVHHHGDGHSHHHAHVHHHGDGHSHHHAHVHHEDGHNHHHHHEHRTAREILQWIEESELSSYVKRKSSAIFQEIARAEGKIHDVSPEEVHFHEVGAMDSIIDIIGVCLALESLRVEQITFSPVPTGHGTIHIAHGLYPVPAPATAEILVGVPLSTFTCQGELTTPTGAAFAKVLASHYSLAAPGKIIKIGYGVGTKRFNHPNVLRTALISEQVTEIISVVECQIDDMTGEMLGNVMQRIFLQEGVLDAYLTAVTMKKNRPGTLITVLCEQKATPLIEAYLLRHTSTFGVRTKATARQILERSFVEYPSKWGPIRLKIGKYQGDIIKAMPEYEDVAQIAEQHGVSFRDVYQEVATYGRTLIQGERP
ncbi:nickel pincer cofactor biosynthesis protein LarC [Aerococcaceae bacterium NML201209]|nr:nickel pincer cofactor biosynthesis protein LarC [Aerococcaceae bacterium NML201209]MCW6666602.1 nickel pincer cofactor biosynthesis protein LarC [Aerococcaceae bacterium NML190938]